VLTSIALIVVPTVLSVVALLLVRAKVAPPGGWLHDLPAAGGIYSTAGTGLAVLLAFLIIGVFDSYETARGATGTESASVQQMYATAQFFDQPYADRLRGDLVCYGRAVISNDFPAMARGREGQVAQYWVDRTHDNLLVTPANDQRQVEALAHFFDVDAIRQDARRSRLAEAQPFVPGFLWGVLGLITLVVLGFQMLFADPSARRLGQAVAMGSMALALFAALTLVWVLDRPFYDRGAAIPHNRMTASLGVMQHTAPATLPCDGDGNPR
jgi:hypothetical protein